MKLTWYGHSCFKAEFMGGSVVFDPYAPGKVPGLELPQMVADVVICSHKHGDHYSPDSVHISGRSHQLAVEQRDLSRRLRRDAPRYEHGFRRFLGWDKTCPSWRPRA